VTEAARPGENEEQRADRNFVDLLQELRVAQTGVQILFGFLLTMPLQARFERLDRYEKTLLVLAVLFLAVATTSIIAPVAWHRALFRHRLKREIVDAANVFAKIGLTALALGVVTSVMLMLDLVVPRWLAATLAASVAVLILAMWLISPLRRRRDLSPR
jgi:Family of unknown function (DUF6328)